MRIKIIMMVKDEDDLLMPWIKHHARLVGADNLLIFDNGSSSERTLQVLDWAERSGVSVGYDQSTSAHFTQRGDFFRDLINEQVTRKWRADFYLPIDCDEFLAVAVNGRPVMSRSALCKELRKYTGNDHPLMIKAGLDNNPCHPGYFRWSPTQRKTFFAAGKCLWLDEGFHHGLAKHGGEPIKTNILYIHFHYKPYRIILQHSKNKLEPYLSDYSRETLIEYIATEQPAFHCATHLLKTEAEYYESFTKDGFERFPEVEEVLRIVGEPLPFTQPAACRVRDSRAGLSEPLIHMGVPPWRRLKRFVSRQSPRRG